MEEGRRGGRGGEVREGRDWRDWRNGKGEEWIRGVLTGEINRNHQAKPETRSITTLPGFIPISSDPANGTNRQTLYTSHHPT